MNGNEFINQLQRQFGGVTQNELAAMLGKESSQLSAIRKQASVSGLTVARMMAGLNKQIVRGDNLLPVVNKKFDLDTRDKAAAYLGMSTAALDKWKARKKGISPRQIVNAVAAAKNASKSETHNALLRPIVEFFPLDVVVSASGSHYELFASRKDAGQQQKDLRSILEKSKGIYIFYDSSGKAIYAGKAHKQTLWSELKSVFNRKRKTQAVYRVHHPERNHKFKAAFEKERDLKKTKVLLGDIAAYVSVYEVDVPMIGKLEALLVRGFANDLLNVRMEKFSIKKSGKKSAR